jgi:hypothetical protein
MLRLAGRVLSSTSDVANLLIHWLSEGCACMYVWRQRCVFWSVVQHDEPSRRSVAIGC